MENVLIQSTTDMEEGGQTKMGYGKKGGSEGGEVRL